MDKQNVLSASNGAIPKSTQIYKEEETLVNPQIMRVKKLREEYERLIAEGI